MNPRNAFSRLPKCPKLKLGYPLCPPAASARWEKAMSTARSRQGKHMPVVGASGRRTQDSLPACQPESYLNLVQWVQCQPDTAGRIGGLADHPAPRAGLVRAPLCSLLGPPVTRGHWSVIPASLLWLGWKLFARRKFPTDKLRKRQRQLSRTNSLDSDSTAIQTGSIDINCPPRDLFFSLSYPVSPAVARRTQSRAMSATSGVNVCHFPTSPRAMVEVPRAPGPETLLSGASGCT